MEDVGYTGDPEDVRLIPGAAGAIRRIRDAGHLVVLVSNQSGVARGLFDEAALSSVHARLESLLRADGAVLDAAYYCPYLEGSAAKVEAYRCQSDLRKPNPGMLLEAARELSIDLARSWMVGNSACDVEAGVRAGCRTILIRGDGSEVGEVGTAPTHSVSTLSEAVAKLEREMKHQPNPGEEPPSLGRDEEVLLVLRDIRELLDRAQRPQRQMDFSLLRLFGALLQMFAIVVALWGVSGLFGEQAEASAARLGLACFLQLAAITAFAIDRFR
jgi:D-glycero-D-manno-heptose 1,7-bisphosphate phosphatase